jgi:hypothetical protein
LQVPIPPILALVLLTSCADVPPAAPAQPLLIATVPAQSRPVAPAPASASPQAAAPVTNLDAAQIGNPPPMPSQVAGQLDRNAIQKTVNLHLREVQRCYERALVKTPALPGKLTFAWVIDPSGAVSTVKLNSSTMANAEVPGCIANAIKGWVFPEFKGRAVTIIYPFVFGVVDSSSFPGDLFQFIQKAEQIEKAR